MTTLLSIALRNDRDAAAARLAAREVSRCLKFDHQDQIRIATAVSELVRWAMRAGNSGAALEFALRHQGRRRLLAILVRGVAEEAASQREDVPGADGWIAAQRLLARFDERAGTGPIALARELPPDARGLDMDAVAHQLRSLIGPINEAIAAPGAELEQQSRELSTMLMELEKRQQELEHLNAELADTNRGVMALYAELDERANHLRQADELKTRFFSNVSHEFRTPLNSIIALSKLLLEQADGPLNSEQIRQVRLIHDAADELYESVSDLLDLAKVEAGKSGLSIGRFSVVDLFGALRGMVRPLLRESPVTLEFDAELEQLPHVIGDEGKVAQVLRNFLSNAVKFTERGSITVSAEVVRRGDCPNGHGEPVAHESILFCVKDTGIGISSEDQELIFDEFTQIRHTLQRRVRGTGLGLPLCRKLAELMGGRVWVESETGRGSTFYFLLPRLYRPAVETYALEPTRAPPDWSMKLPVLIVADEADVRQRLESLFREPAFAPVSCTREEVTGDYLSALRPRVAVVATASASVAIETTLALLRKAHVPAVTAGAIPEADCPISDETVHAAKREIVRTHLGRILLIDDDERFRILLTRCAEPLSRETLSVSDAEDALVALSRGNFDCAVLDLIMPETDGFTLLRLLREDASTRDMPVLICSSMTISADERESLHQLRAAYLPKTRLSPDTLAQGLVEAMIQAGHQTAQTAQPPSRAVSR